MEEMFLLALEQSNGYPRSVLGVLIWPPESMTDTIPHVDSASDQGYRQPTELRTCTGQGVYFMHLCIL